MKSDNLKTESNHFYYSFGLWTGIKMYNSQSEEARHQFQKGFASDIIITILKYFEFLLELYFHIDCTLELKRRESRENCKS